MCPNSKQGQLQKDNLFCFRPLVGLLSAPLNYPPLKRTVQQLSYGRGSWKNMYCLSYPQSNLLCHTVVNRLVLSHEDGTKIMPSRRIFLAPFGSV